MVSPAPVNQLIVLAHPDPDSFCASVARRWLERVRKNQQIGAIRDLYADGFDPVLKSNEQPGKAGYAPLAENLAERRRLEELDVLVFVYPVWLGSPPAMFKGYLERVVGNGIHFGGDAPDPKPLCNVRLVQISTSASRMPWLAERGIPGALHTIFDQYVAELLGAKQTYRLHLDAITEEMKEPHGAIELAKVEELADHVCAESNADRWERARSAPPAGRPGGEPTS